MAHRKSSISLALVFLAAAAAPAAAQYYDELSRNDGIAISGGDAKAANMAIQTPTPWPPYVNDVTFGRSGADGVSVMQRFYDRYKAPEQPTTVINIGTPTGQ